MGLSPRNSWRPDRKSKPFSLTVRLRGDKLQTQLDSATGLYMTATYLQRILSILCVFAAFTSYADDNIRSMESHADPLSIPANHAWQLNVDVGWDSAYISQGRNNLDNGGIYWLSTTAQLGNVSTFVVVGRGDSEPYTEWNVGLEYGIEIAKNIDAHLGYQRIEIQSDEDCSDNEFFAELTYNAHPWLMPSINYVYSTESAGYFVELSLHSQWQLSDQLTLTPYITQGIDVNYATAQHNGANNLQFGLEAEYIVSPSVTLNAHLSHSIAQNDITQEAAYTDNTKLDESYVGLHLSWTLP